MRTRDKNDYRKACRVRNRVKNMINKARKKHEKFIAEKIKTDPKLTWNYIKSKTSMQVGIPNLYKDNSMSSITEYDKEKAEALSAFFKSVYVTEPADEIPKNQPSKI